MLAKSLPGSLRTAHFSLASVGMMCAFPFLYYLHAYPITTFYQEWVAAFLGVCAAALLLSRRFWVEPEIPRIVLLPLGLALLVMVQYALGRGVYFEHALLVSLYLLWAALLVMLGRCLRQEIGLPLMVTVLSACVLAGAELNALSGVLQHYRWRTFLDSVITVKSSAAVYGNVAQPNHYANYISLGLISLGLLYARFSWRAWQVVLLALPLLFVLVLSGSRSPGLYLIGMAGLAFLWYRRDKSGLPLLRYSAWVIAGFVLMHLVVQIPALVGADGTVTTMQRLMNANSGTLRLYLWRESWLIFSQFPLLGAGFGQFGWHHFLLTEQLRDINISGLYNNAHNLVMHIAAEMGLAGLFVLLATLALWLRQALRTSEQNAYLWWGYSVLAVLGIHSLLEYPLWYAYFLGPAALVLGMLDNTTYRLELRQLGRLSLGALLAMGLVMLSQVWQGYRKLEALQATSPASMASNAAFNRKMREELVAMYDRPLMVPMAELFMTNLIEINAEHLADKLALNGRAMRAVPISPLVYRQAILLALAGEHSAAELQMKRAIWSYPADFGRVARQLGNMALKDPVHFSALLKFALQDYEEQQSAVRAR